MLGAQAKLLLLCLVLLLDDRANALDTAIVSNRLRAKKTQIQKLASVVESQWKTFLNTTKNGGTNYPKGVSTGVLSGCGNDLPNAECDPTLGLTKGCECGGKKVTRNKVIIKALDATRDPAAHQKAGNVAAFLAQDQKLSDAFSATSGQLDFENKLMYFGSIDGVMTYFPAVLWTRADQTCGQRYDPRIRPWYLSGSNGPKNIIFILDSSGSMGGRSGRMELLKKAAQELVNALTFADYVGVVDFDDEARTFLGLTFLAPASKPFRDKIKDHIQNTIKAEDGTNFHAAFQRAFEMADISYKTNYHSGCQTAYVFLTDGQNTGADPTSMIRGKKSFNSLPAVCLGFRV